MKRLIVLRRNEEDNRMYIIEENKFEMTLLSECYDKFGQKRTAIGLSCQIS